MHSWIPLSPIFIRSLEATRKMNFTMRGEAAFNGAQLASILGFIP